MTNFWQAVAETTQDTLRQVEYRLYYDNASGKPLFYTCDELPGNYIIVEQEVYQNGRYDITVVEGKIKYPSTIGSMKLVPADTGTLCYSNDVSIISQHISNSQFWKLKYYEKD